MGGDRDRAGPWPLRRLGVGEESKGGRGEGSREGCHRSRWRNASWGNRHTSWERQISPGRNLQTFGGDIDMHVFITLMALIVFGVRGGRDMALAVGEEGTRCGSGVCEGEGFEGGGPQREQDGGYFSLGVTGTSS